MFEPHLGQSSSSPSIETLKPHSGQGRRFIRFSNIEYLTSTALMISIARMIAIGYLTALNRGLA